MPIKIFSHQADPDGIGCVILAKRSFKEVDYTLCKNITDLDSKLENFILNKDYLNYERIYITDLCPSINLLDEIAREEQFSKKLLVIDHHISNLKNVEQKNYSFVKINLEGCATSLFYDYLKQNNLISSNDSLKEFVLLTRLHDTWEWKESNNLDAYHLETLFHKLGNVGYLNHFFDKLNLESKHFAYSEEEKLWIKEQLKEEEKYLNNLINRVIYKKIDDVLYGIVYGLYNYRNSLADKLSENKSCDVLVFMAVDNETVSFRSINDNIEVDKIAKEFNGYGHKKAAACNLNYENESKLIEKYLI